MSIRLTGQSLPVQWISDQPIPLVLPDSLKPESVYDTCLVYLTKLHEKAYLGASFDSVWYTEDLIWVKVHLGKPYAWSYLDFSGVPPFIKDQLTTAIRPERLFAFDEVQRLFEEILDRAENHGYPLAAVHLDSIGIQNEMIKARVEVMLNDQIKVERIRIDGDLKLGNRYLYHLIDMKEGELFARQKIIDIRNRLATVSFIKYEKDPLVDFLGNGATLNLFLNKKNANRFDILLGLLPSNDENRRFQLTGNVNFDLANQFGDGEVIRFNYESLMPGTQNLDLTLNYPFIFSWSFGTEVNFNLYKRDTSYIDVAYQAGLQYLLRGHNYFQFFIENQRTNLLTVDTSQIKQTRQLPSFLDVTQKLFGTALHFEKLNYRLNPRSGYDLTLRVSAGTKRINKNSTIVSLKDSSDPEYDFNDLYKTLDLNSFQYKLSGQIISYLPLFKSSAVKFSVSSALIGSGQALYDNELYRIGGTKLLRGFNEESVFASFYSVFTSEYRLLFNQNSNLFIFWDLAYLEKVTDLSRQFDRPMGLGTGLNLETKVGVFSISYAIGAQRNQALTFREGRIHFGMISQF